jgi:pimeloyl-ACP methyl ester carboxylesterase
VARRIDRRVFIVVGGFLLVALAILRLPYFLLPRDPSGENNRWVQYNGSDTVIVFLHGIFSDTEGCWTNRSRKDTPVFFPDLVKQDKETFGEPAIFVAGYQTTIRTGNYGVADVTREVWDGISVPAEPKRLPVMAKKNIVFICHSTGGIVARYLLLEHRDAFKDKNVGLVLIASPSAGSEIASMVAPLARLYNATLLRELRLNNPLLANLDDRFRDFLYKHSTRISGIEMFEARGMAAGLITAVNKDSASRYFGMPARLAGLDHVSSVKPADRNHRAYKELASFYRNDFLRMVQTSARCMPPFESATREMRTDTGNVVVAAITADGSEMAYAERAARTQTLKLRDLDHPQDTITLLAPDGPGDYRPYRGITFDPTGQRIFYIRSRKKAPRVHDLWRITPFGTSNRLVLADVDTAIAFNPRNPTQFAYCHGNPPKLQSEVLVASLSSSGRAIVDPQPRVIRHDPSTVQKVVWSPMGDSFLVIGANRAANEMDLAIVGSDGRETPIATTVRWRSIDSAVWLPTGEILFAASAVEGGPQRIWLTRPSDGDVTAVTRDLGSYRSLAASTDGRRLIALTEVTSSRIYLSTIGASTPEDQLPHASVYYDGVDGVATAPNGEVVFTRRLGATQDLVYYDPVKGVSRDLVSGEGRNESPAVCRTAGFALYTKSVDGKTNIWKVTLDGSSTEQVTTGTWDADATCTSDASRVIYSGFDPSTRSRGLWSMSSGQSRRIKLILFNPTKRENCSVANIDARNSVLSPDGNRLATIFADPYNDYSWTIGALDLQTLELKRSAKVLVGTDRIPAIRWRSNDEMTILSNDNRTPLFWTWNVKTDQLGSPVTVPGVPWVFDFDWNQPGKSMVYAGGREESDIVTFTEVAAHH